MALSSTSDDLAAQSDTDNTMGNIHNLDHIEGNEKPLHFPEEDDLKASTSMEQMIKDARASTEKEHNMSLLQGIKLYPKAIGWSLLISTCIAMEGYDVCLLSNFCKFNRPRLYGRFIILIIQMHFLNSMRSMVNNYLMGHGRCQLNGKQV